MIISTTVHLFPQTMRDLSPSAQPALVAVLLTIAMCTCVKAPSWNIFLRAKRDFTAITMLVFPRARLDCTAAQQRHTACSDCSLAAASDLHYCWTYYVY